MIGQNVKFKFRVTHVESEGPCLKLWAQIDQHLSQRVLEKLAEFVGYLDQSMNDCYRNLNNAKGNAVCFIRLSNNQYRRGRILDFLPEGVRVRLIDTGYICIVNFHNVCFLDESPAAKYLEALPQAAEEFVVADVVPRNGQIWTDEVLGFIRPALVGKDFSGYYQISNNAKLLKFEFMNEDFAEFLVRRNLALFW